MCGIAGFVCRDRPESDPAAVISSMTDSMSHRGPDSRGTALLALGDPPATVAFGHRRLSIIDLTPQAGQPMWNAAGDLCITYNGEIYNYIELRGELEAKGYAFRTGSDTEVVLHAYDAWQTGCFGRFNGMWGMAIFDRARRKVVLSRDRLGKKPLYYAATGREVVFASEVKALLRYPGVAPRPNAGKVYRYLATNYRFVDGDDESFFEGILQVPKGGYLEVDEHLRISGGTYWRLEPDFGRGERLSESEAVREFRDLFVDAVRLRLRSDVPVGCMLSGGMDSTSITCVAYKVLGTPIVAFSGITGEGRGVYDESEYVRAVVAETNAECHFIRPDPSDVFDTVDEMLARHDEPVCTVTWYTLYGIAKKIRLERVPVILNGHGGDELLAGYWDHYHYHFYDLEKAGETAALERERELWRRNHGRDPSEIARNREFIGRLDRGEASGMSRFPDYSACLAEDVRDRYRRDYGRRNPFRSLLSGRLYNELLYETVPAVLRPEDRNTMSQSIESRSPFLDHRLVEFCLALPNRFKIRDGLGKWILREAMRGILPESVRTRKDKAGFIAPADEWFRTVNRAQIERMLGTEPFLSRALLEPAGFRRVYAEHLSGTANHQMFLWQAINLELWFRRMIDRSPAA